MQNRIVITVSEYLGVSYLALTAKILRIAKVIVERTIEIMPVG